MTISATESRVYLVLLAFFCGMFIGVVVAGISADDHWKRATVIRGVAEYCQLTGKWQWKEPE